MEKKENNKVGILTFFDYNNYGTVLQAYALQEKLNEWDIYSEFIDYKSYDNRKNFHQKIFEAIKHPKKLIDILYMHIKSIKNKDEISKTLGKYNEFRNAFKVSREKYFYKEDLRKSIGNYDTYIIGSDQTWNTNLPITTSAFFLDFVPNDKTKISYAPSLGGKNITKIKEYKIKENLKQFDAISCRDKVGVKLIENSIGKDVKYVLDPTFLIDIEKWENLSSSSLDIKQEYIICYFLGKKKENFEIVEKYAKENNVKLYYIFNFDTNVNKSRNYLYGIGPKEFLTVIRNAKCVFTDSFHGTVFSILFNKEFYSFTKRKNLDSSDNNRIYEILENFNLSSRYVEKYQDIEKAKEINYDEVIKIINKQKEESIQFLKNSLEIHIGDKIISMNHCGCTGCTACYNVCPKNCIEMKENSEGFLYPYINKKECINCGKCRKVCQIFEKQNILNDTKSYVAINKNKTILMESSSGGVFFNIAKNIINEKGIVCACTLNKKMQAEHIIVNNKKDIAKIMGSKYIQSNLKDTFKSIEEYLKQNKKILYVGTPCQIYGLKKYLGKEYENLLTIDLICHGVPSQKFFNEYIKNLKSNVVEYKFRYKNSNDDCDTHRLYYKYINGKEIVINNPFIDSYYYAFLNSYNYRECCYNCDFANINRVGDITLGDFWGCNNYHKIDSKNGVSAVLVNTEKGKKEFNKIKEEFFITNTEVEYIRAKNHNLNKPVERPSIRDNIYNILEKKGYKYICEKYLRPPDYISLKIKSYIPLKVKRNIIKLVRRNY